MLSCLVYFMFYFVLIVLLRITIRVAISKPFNPALKSEYLYANISTTVIDEISVIHYYCSKTYYNLQCLYLFLFLSTLDNSTLPICITVVNTCIIWNVGTWCVGWLLVSNSMGNIMLVVGQVVSRYCLGSYQLVGRQQVPTLQFINYYTCVV